MLDDVIAHHLAALLGCGLNDALNVLYMYREPSVLAHTDEDGHALALGIYDEHRAACGDSDRTNEDLTFAYALRDGCLPAIKLHTIK